MAAFAERYGGVGNWSFQEEGGSVPATLVESGAYARTYAAGSGGCFRSARCWMVAGQGARDDCKCRKWRPLRSAMGASATGLFRRKAEVCRQLSWNPAHTRAPTQRAPAAASARRAAGWLRGKGRE